MGYTVAHMNDATKQCILLGITGGIAAYKTPELVRRLRDQGCEVRVVMTASACEFITPLTLQAVSGQPVHRELLDPDAEAAMGHIELARWADHVVIAPATANFIARLSHGLADDLLSALCLASTVPLILCPAMNQAMWSAAATQANVALLCQRGVRLLGPASGAQACGETGPGRMLEADDIVRQLFDKPWRGRRVLITAGPTREALDPVRFLSNRSSGKMGYALAVAAAARGAEVSLVSGPTALPVPTGTRRSEITTAREMHAEVMAQIGETDIFIACAAVADYAPAEIGTQKLKKGAATLTLELTRTPDILAEVAALPKPPFTVGFAAETEKLEQHAYAKLLEKSLDLIAANAVNVPGTGFDSDNNNLSLYWHEGSKDLGTGTKTTLAEQLIDVIDKQYRNKNPA